MQQAGIVVFRDEKPDIFCPVWQGDPRFSAIPPAFYNSREIKELGTVTVKIKGARSVGVLLAEKGVFITYNLGNALMKWQYRAELRTKALMQTILCRERLPEQYAPEDVKGLLLGNSMELAAGILSGEGGKQYLLLDGSYDHFYFLTNIPDKGKALYCIAFCIGHRFPDDPGIFRFHILLRLACGFRRFGSGRL